MLVGIFTWNIGLGTIITSVIVGLVGYVLHRKDSQIHVLVNSRMTEVMADVKTLRKQLKDAGIAPTAGEERSPG